MFELMSKVKVDASDKTQQYEFDKKAGQFESFTTSSTRATNDMKSAAEKYIKTAGLEELMRVNDSGKNIKILVKSGATDSQIKEL
jgi:hypothetical protein